MKQSLLLSRSVALCVAICFQVGCQPAEESTETNAENAMPAGGHSHDHADLGPRGGHLLHLEPAGAHAEWVHDDKSHIISVYFDDFEEGSVRAAVFCVDVNGSKEEFSLSANGGGWEVTSEALMNHINMGESADVQLIVQHADEESTAKVEAHEHHDH